METYRILVFNETLEEGLVMKLGQIFSSISMWQKLAQVKMSPAIAYSILKYVRLLGQEHELVEKQRVAIIREITNTKDGEDASIAMDTPEHSMYVERFAAVLDVESDIKCCDGKFCDLIEAVSRNKEFELTVQEIATLEPFFAA
jgi:hypothetical protein